MASAFNSLLLFPVFILSPENSPLITVKAFSPYLALALALGASTSTNSSKAKLFVLMLE
jgi:hypothetical protein